MFGGGMIKLLASKHYQTGFQPYVTKRMMIIMIFMLSMGTIYVTQNFEILFALQTPKYIGDKIQNINFNNTTRKIEISNTNSVNVCMLVRVYGPQISYLPVLALGVFHAGFDNIQIYIINTDNRTDVQRLLHTIDLINKIIRRPDYATFLNLGVSAAQDFGYKLTDYALSYLYNQYNQSSSICQYLIVTNGDNFYSKHLGKKIRHHMIAGKDIIAWDFVSHYHHQKLKKNEKMSRHNVEVVDDGTSKCLAVKLILNSIDLGAAAYRLAFLYQHKLYFYSPKRGYFSGCDGLFTEQAIHLANNSVIIRQTLFVHQ